MTPQHHTVGQGSAGTGAGGRHRRWLGLVVAGLLVGGACGSDGDDAASDDVTSGEEGAAGSPDEGGETSPTAAAAGEEAGSLGDNIVIGPVEDGAEPTSGGSITIGLESETNSYLPSIFQGSQAGYNVAYAIYDPLVTRNEDGDIEPYLAESIEPNDDFTEWTLTLRPDVLFHDGTPLEAEAMKTMFDDYLTAEGANTRGNLAGVTSLDVVDELTVRYVLAQPNAAFPDLLALPAGWPFSPTAAAALGEDFGNQPVGTGPFRFVSWQRDGAFVVERNPDYWQDGLPYLDEITFRPIPDEETRATSLSSGDIDAVQSVRLSSFLARVQDAPGVEIALGLGNGSGNIMFNVTAPPVDDIRIRQALSHALDQQALVEVVAGEAAAATELRSQYFWSGSAYYSEAVADAWPTYDPELAQELYDDYINDPDRSDGKSVGEPVEINYGCTNVPSLIEQATAIQGFWEGLGADVTVDPLEQSAHIAEALGGDYQAKCFRAGADWDPVTVLETAFGDPSVVVTNLTDYTSPVIDDAIGTLRTTDDLESRQEAVEEVGLQLAEDLPLYWTGSDLTFIGYEEGLHGVNSWRLPSGSLGDGAAPGITFWSQVWVEPGGQE
jgi:peptide/nickel transport system substrate-binding protein